MNSIQCHGFFSVTFTILILVQIEIFYNLLSLNLRFIKVISLQNIRFSFDYKIGWITSIFFVDVDFFSLKVCPLFVAQFYINLQISEYSSHFIYFDDI